MFGSLKHLSARVKILLIGFILILLPVAIISFMSFKSLNQKAENLEVKYDGTLRLVRDKLETEVLQFESELQNEVLELLSKPKNIQELKDWLQKARQTNPIFKQLVLVNQNNGLLSSKLSINWNDYKAPFTLGNDQAEKYFKQAENAEFKNKNYKTAISLYQMALNSASTDQERAILFHRIGRCYYSTHSYQKGIGEYKKIHVLAEENIRIGGVPAKVIALSQIVAAYDSLDQNQEYNSTAVDLFEYLIDNPWDLSGGYQYYLNNTKTQIQKLSNPDSILEDRLKILDSKILELQEDIDFLTRIAIEELPYPAVIKLPSALQQFELSSLVFSFNEAYVLSDLFPALLDSVELGKDVIVGILGENDSLLFSQQHIPTVSYLVKEDFTQVFGNWSVALFDPESKTIEELVGKEKLLYLLLFIGIIIVTLIGVVVLVRAVNQESRVMKMKSEFISNVSHELKTPLALIRMFGETLESGIVTDEKKQKEFYSIIRKESERLTHLVNNVLDFSRMDTGEKQYNFTEVNLLEIVRSSLEAYKFHIRDNGFEIDSEFLDEQIDLRVDRDAISQALLNLLSNAVKYSDENKFIKVKVYKNHNSAFISVMDRGIGIPEDELSKIFDKFYQVAPGKSKRIKGSGLGLSITRQIIEAHQGQIEVESQFGKGSTFTLKIPLHLSHSADQINSKA